VSSAEEKNMALARCLMEARVKGDLDALDEMMSPTLSATPNCYPTNSPTAKAKNGWPSNSPPPFPTAGC
jgi:hypothetical protein